MTVNPLPAMPVGRRTVLRTGALLLASLAAAPMLGALAACASAGPRPIAYGRDQCANCRMVVSDPRYAAELVTAKGRTLVFDSVECLATYLIRETRDAAGGSPWVATHDAPATLVPAERALFRRVTGPGSPMGKGLTAYASPSAAGAETLPWADVVTLVRREGLRRGGDRADGA